jgi:hypothetical protein
MKLAHQWATNTNYATGPDTGTATKIDPASDADGFVRGVAAAAQHVNFHINALATAARRSFTLATLALRPLDCEDQDDLSSGFAAVAGHFDAAPIVLAKASTTGVVATTDGHVAESRGVLNQITDGVAGAARGPSSTRSVVIGLGGTGNTSSTNNGDGWGAGASTGLLGDLVAVAATGTNFIVASATGGSAHGTGAGAWTAATALSDIGDVATSGDVTSLAALTGGVVVAVGSDGTGPVIARTTDVGVTWAAASGAIPNAADHVDSGWVTGDEGATLWHAGYQDDFVTIDVAVSTNGNTWTTRATLTSTITGGIQGIRILKCPTTDLLVLATQHLESVQVRASTDDGVTWSEPQTLLGFTLPNLAVCGGRLFGSRGAKLFASDGVGSEN